MVTGETLAKPRRQTMLDGEPSLARVVSAAGVQPTRPGSIPVGDDPRVSPGKIPLREAERVWWCVRCELLSRRILGPPR